MPTPRHPEHMAYMRSRKKVAGMGVGGKKNSFADFVPKKPIATRRNYTPPPKHPLPWPPMGGTKPLDPGPAQPPKTRRRRLVQPWENSRNFA